MPVILRKSQDGKVYEFVGECYLHGFMDAEAIALQIKGVLKEQDFILVKFRRRLVSQNRIPENGYFR